MNAVPREDRDLVASPFAGFTADRLRTAISKACKATGTPLFSPHDLRHREATLWHLGGVPASQAAAWLGHFAQEHLRTYAHVMLDRTEIDYAAMTDWASRGKAERAMRGLGYALAVMAALLAVVGLFFVVAAGGYEPEPIRAAGVYMLALAAVIGLAATFALRSGNAK